MRGKVCVITGATSGIGLETAKELAAMGARLVLVGRDRKRGAAALRQLTSPATIYYGDLSLLSEMKRVAGEIAAAEPKIDVLINDVGAAFSPRQVTPDGLEKTFALNHLSYFVLTNLLLERLKAAAPSRIINVASGAHHGNRLDFSDLQFEKGYRGYRAYGKTKLANILFTRELARRIAGTGVTVNALHPGFVRTHIGDNIGGIQSAIFWLLKLTARSVRKGAETVVYLASSPEMADVSGQYFFDCRRATPSAAAQNDEDARRLWQESVWLSGVG